MRMNRIETFSRALNGFSTEYSGPRSLFLAGLFLLLVGWMASGAFGQTTDLPGGFTAVQGKHIELITDLPINEEIRELVDAFDAAIPAWCATFGKAETAVSDWRVRAYMMLDRERFRAAGFIPSSLPNFAFGFQRGDQLWVTEQPSAYYRRHLLLHEGTHWFMDRACGGSGPPWLMEGMAELFATHRWDGEQLKLGIVPRSNAEVPYWGRLTLIQKQLADGSAPSLEAILRYNKTAHQSVDAYAWSWAAVLFLKDHSDSQAAFAEMLLQPMRDDATLTRWLFERLREPWPRLRGAWQAFVTDLEYGYDASRGMLSLNPQVRELSVGNSMDAVIRTDRSWQSLGVNVSSADRLKISAKGRFTVAQTPSPWVSEPQGISLEYYRGNPLGRLMLMVVPTLPREVEKSAPIEPIAVGVGGEFKLEYAGELFMRVNESTGDLNDNTGEIEVMVSR